MMHAFLCLVYVRESGLVLKCALALSPFSLLRCPCLFLFKFGGCDAKVSHCVENRQSVCESRDRGSRLKT